MPKQRLESRGDAQPEGRAAERGGARASTPMRRRVGPSGRRAPVVTLRALLDGKVVEGTVTREAPLRQIAAEWGYVLRSRARWVDKPDVRRSLRERALAALEALGVERKLVRQLAGVEHVEVELHAWDAGEAATNAICEAAAECPWEYLVSAGTRALGRFGPILITRLLRNGSRASEPATPEVLFVQSAPGRLEGVYDFSSERARLRAAVGAEREWTSELPKGAGRALEVSESERVADLRRRIRARRHDVLHVSGVDTQQAAALAPGIYDDLATRAKLWQGIADADGRIRDGMLMRNLDPLERPLPALELAELLVDPKSPPFLVTLNLYYSGARTAREIVRAGAHAALGFLDDVDDELAEHFFQAFYWAWCRPGATAPIARAFVEAWQQMRGKGDRLHGTAIAVWLGQSVVEPQRRRRQAAPLGAEEAATEPRAERLARQRETPIDKLLQVELKVPKEVNYSLLHNNRPLLEKLTLTKLVKEPLEAIEVLVELNHGGQSYPFRRTVLVLDEPQLALAGSVCIPLTATLPRSLRERVHSTVYVKVRCGGRTALETTERVILIPVDEWLDDSEENPWLPSFVLPRDPAVPRIVAAARRFLVGIRDDPAAGFDGYQAFDAEAEEPAAGVDAQVRAIWTALVNEYRLQYINPPPSYSQRSQRLRTPSEIVASASGTCIDLSLLLASCLEYIDVYPVLVLLTGHAFVGYWRSEEAHAAFVAVQKVPPRSPALGSAAARRAAVPLVTKYGWRLTRQQYDEILAAVGSGDLVLLEATFLTGAASFAVAVAEGRANLRSRRELDSLLDIRLARSADPPVTPLPLLDLPEAEDGSATA